ncbi:hypothetical protein Goarm_010216 [Gossypium armourianum]|uniref:AT-hook motif nuclear-localized protein n=1 Tax=Gossypium armourianum TaxID=34283 RepID=A0A7J9JVB2_9ROSI|nr:hypothetical protein [Gossypium armourianum]
MGGSVVGTVTCSGPIVIMAASFSNVAYERLPLEEEEPPQFLIPSSAIESSSDAVGEQQQRQQALAESNVPLFHGLPPNILNFIQLPNDAFWANGGRPPF